VAQLGLKAMQLPVVDLRVHRERPVRLLADRLSFFRDAVHAFSLEFAGAGGLSPGGDA
jgi:hypothetical protein